MAGKTLYITGASRGIGKAIALKAAKDGANVVVAAKTAEAHPKLPGTIFTAAKESKIYKTYMTLMIHSARPTVQPYQLIKLGFGLAPCTVYHL